MMSLLYIKVITLCKFILTFFNAVLKKFSDESEIEFEFISMMGVESAPPLCVRACVRVLGSYLSVLHKVTELPWFNV